MPELLHLFYHVLRLVLVNRNVMGVERFIIESRGFNAALDKAFSCSWSGAVELSWTYWSK